MVESHKSHAGWIKIQIEVNAAGLFKTVNQCKDKLRNLKDAYKAACDNNNKQTGADAKFPPFFDTFYEIFGTRDVINMPNVLDSGHSNQKTDIDSKNNNNNQQTTNINKQQTSTKAATTTVRKTKDVTLRMNIQTRAILIRH